MADEKTEVETQEEQPLDPIAVAILDFLAAAPEPVDPVEIAKAIAEQKRKRMDPPDLWRRYKMAVNQQAKHLARLGAIEILRKGIPVDPTEPIKGLVKLRLTEA